MTHYCAHYVNMWNYTLLPNLGGDYQLNVYLTPRLVHINLFEYFMCYEIFEIFKSSNKVIFYMIFKIDFIWKFSEYFENYILVSFASKCFQNILFILLSKHFAKKYFFWLKLNFKAKTKAKWNRAKQGRKKGLSVVSGRPEARVRTSGPSRVKI